MAWKAKVKEKREQLASKIPRNWVIDETTIQKLREVKVGLSEEIDKLCPESENLVTHSTILKLHSSIHTGELTCYQVVYSFCHRAALIHQVVNCLSEIMFTEALERAKLLDERKPDKLLPLYGIPISLKDQCNVAGYDTTLGYLGRAFKPKTAAEESLLVKFLKDLGAVLYVKTTVPSSMMASETVSNTFGYTLNSVNTNFSSGGSSGGEGSLIGCYGSILGIGTDIGGSIRIPSSFQGLFGLRPTHGRLPYLKVDNSFEGQELIPSVIGPLARNLEDLEFFMELIVNKCKPWEYDVKCLEYHWDSKTALHDNYNVGIWYTDGIVTPPPSIARALNKCEEIINSAPGFKAVQWAPDTELNSSIYQVGSEIYGADHMEEIKKDFAVSGEPMIKVLGNLMSENGVCKPLSVNEWWAIGKRKYDLQQRYLDYYRSFDKCPDVIIAPVTLMPFRPDENENMSLNYLVPINVLNFPSLVVPVTEVDISLDREVDPNSALSEMDRVEMKYWNGLIEDGSIQGFPVALQVFSPRYKDDEVCKFGHWLAKELGRL